MSQGDEPTVKSITRVKAQSGVGYATEDVVIHETSKRRIVFKPWYIPHKTKAHGLAGKLILQEASEFGWADAKTINLDEAALSALRRSFEEQVEVAQTGEEGTLVLIRGTGVEEGTDADAREIAQALAGLLRRRDVLGRFAQEDLSEEIVMALRSSLRLQELKRAVQELRDLLDSGASDEQLYQDWCTDHSWAFGNAHTTADDIRRVSRTNEVDVLLPRVLTGYRDIVELKRPDHPVLRQHAGRDTYYWSREASQAIGQCHDYMDNLHADAAYGLRGRREIIAYHPRATIVIGRSADWSEDTYRALAGLNQRLSGITLMTYDQLLAQGDELVRLFTEEGRVAEPPAS